MRFRDAIEARILNKVKLFGLRLSPDNIKVRLEGKVWHLTVTDIAREMFDLLRSTTYVLNKWEIEKKIAEVKWELFQAFADIEPADGWI